MNDVLAAWNLKSPADAVSEVLPCCGSRAWAEALVAGRPYRGHAELCEAATAAWWSLAEADWLEAFACHPRIGESGKGQGPARFEEWSRQEQSHMAIADEAVRRAIARENQKYAEQFGFTYIVCATGKSAEEMLEILRRRLGNDLPTELRQAAEQQSQITQIRLSKWMRE